MASANAYTPMGWYVASLAVDPMDADTVWPPAWTGSARDGGRTWGVSRSGGIPVCPDSFMPTARLVFHPATRHDEPAGVRVDRRRIYRTTTRARPSRATLHAVGDQGGLDSADHNFGVTQFYHGMPFPDGSAYLGGTQDNGTLVARMRAASTGGSGLRRDGGYVAIDPSART